MVTTRRTSSSNIYGEVSSPSSIRTINRLIRRDIRGARTRAQVSALKRRSDYLATLTRSPAWRTRFGDRVDTLLEVAKNENGRTVKLANQIARKRGWDVEYDPWGN